MFALLRRITAACPAWLAALVLSLPLISGTPGTATGDDFAVSSETVAASAGKAAVAAAGRTALATEFSSVLPLAAPEPATWAWPGAACVPPAWVGAPFRPRPYRHHLATGPPPTPVAS